MLKNNHQRLTKPFLFWKGIGIGLFLSCLFFSCDLINPTEALPAYLQINDFTITTTAEQGGNSEQITDVWVFINGESLGIYELPATVPVLAAGEQTIFLSPVIRENALRSAPIIYPFYERYEVQLNLVPEETIIIQPTTTYLTNNAVFELVEDFETSNHRLNGGNQTAVQITNDPSKALVGNGAGQIVLKEETAVEFTSSTTFLDLPTQGGLPVFLEIDYKTNVEFEIGLVGLDPNSATPIIGINYKVTLCPVEEWNKIYINFQEDLQFSQLPAYQLAFRVSTDNTGCDRLTNEVAEVLIDNVKFIRFQN